MQAVAALRGQFGGHQVMTTAEGDKLRDETAAGPKTAEATVVKAATKEKPPATANEAAAKGRKAAAAGPSSGSGSTGDTPKRAPKKA